MSEGLTPAEQAVAVVLARSLIAPVPPHVVSAAVAAAQPHIEAEALRAEAERTYLHTTIGQSGQRSYSHRNIHGERTRDALLKRAAEIEGGSDA